MTPVGQCQLVLAYFTIQNHLQCTIHYPSHLNTNCNVYLICEQLFLHLRSWYQFVLVNYFAMYTAVLFSSIFLLQPALYTSFHHSQSLSAASSLQWHSTELPPLCRVTGIWWCVIFLESWMHMQETRCAPFLEAERKLQWMKAVLMLACDLPLSCTNSALQHYVPHLSRCRLWNVIFCSIYFGIPILTYQRPVMQIMYPQVSSFSNI